MMLHASNARQRDQKKVQGHPGLCETLLPLKGETKAYFSLQQLADYNPMIYAHQKA